MKETSNSRLYSFKDSDLLDIAKDIFDSFLTDINDFEHQFVSFNGEFVHLWQTTMERAYSLINESERIEELLSNLNLIWRIINEVNYASELVYRGNRVKLLAYKIKRKENVNLPSKVTMLDYNPATGEFKWNAAENAKLYQLQILDRSKGNDVWEEALMTPMTYIEYTPAVGDWLFRVRSFNDSGFGEASEEIDVYIGNYMY